MTEHEQDVDSQEVDKESTVAGEVGRYIKLTSVERAETPELRKWIKQAGTAPGRRVG